MSTLHSDHCLPDQIQERDEIHGSVIFALTYWGFDGPGCPHEEGYDHSSGHES